MKTPFYIKAMLALSATMFINISTCEAQTMTSDVDTKPFSTFTTAYPKYMPAVINLKDGRTLAQSQVNIFLKNASLVYKKGSFNMKANLKNISSVDFSDRTYVPLDSMMAQVVDTVGKKMLLCVTKIDVEAYKGQMTNGRQITNLEIGDSQLGVTSVDPASEDNWEFPIIQTFYFKVENKLIKAHERDLKRFISKNKKSGRLIQGIINRENFSWQDTNSLKEILKLL